MPRRAEGLSAAKVAEAGPGRYGDGNGLYLLVRPSRAKLAPGETAALTRFWLFRYTRSGKMREMGLGAAGRGGLSLTNARSRARERHRMAQNRDHEPNARSRARELTVMVRDGRDPLAEREGDERTNNPHRRQQGQSPTKWPTEFIDVLRGNIELDQPDAAPGRSKIKADLKKLSDSAGFILKQLRGQRRRHAPQAPDPLPAAAYALEVDGETPANQQTQDIFDQDQGQQHSPDSIGRVSEYADQDHDPRGFPMREFLMSEREADLPHMQELVLGLRFLEDRCNEKLKAQPDSNRGAKPKPSIFAKNIPNAHTMCALMVLLWWRKQTGQLPGVHNAAALAACAQLWKAARGQERTHPAKSAEDRGTTGWRASMADARDRWLATWQAEAIRNVLGDWG